MKNSITNVLLLFLLLSPNVLFSQNEHLAKEDFEKGMNFLELGKYEDAEFALKSAISYDSTGECSTGIIGQAYSKLGYALYMRPSSISDKSYDFEAIPVLKKAIELNPENPEALTSLGVVYIVTYEKDSAAFYIDRAIEVDPTYAPAYYQKNRIIDEDEFPEEAFKYINLFFQHVDPNNNRDGSMLSFAKFTHLQLQKKLGLLTLNTFQDTIHTYYINQTDKIVDYTIQIVNYPTTSAKDHFESALKGFYSALFSANPTIKEQFDARKNEIMQPEFIEFFDELIQKDFAQMQSSIENGPKLNDFFWGAFFATGNTNYLDELLASCRYYGEKKSLNLFLMGGTAMWSLSSNAESSELVKSHLENKKRNKYAKMILSKSPKYFYEETRRLTKIRFADQLEK